MAIGRLRELIRTGEFLEKNLNDDTVRNQWLFDVEDFICTLDNTVQRRISSQMHTLKNLPWDYTPNRNNFGLLMGFLRSLYNSGTSENKALAANSQAVFIVHGHDDSLIGEVKECVIELGLKPIVLREQPDKGLTIIEKLEDWLGNCKCAIVLYTPCDIGRAVDEKCDKPRARQNVVYEHGLFQGYLGRKRVIALRKGGTELPGDCSGVVYTSVDTKEWQEQLKSNIRAIDR